MRKRSGEPRGSCTGFVHTHLEFFVVKGFEEVLRDELTESLLQCQKLGFNPTHKPPVHVESEKHIQVDTGIKKRGGHSVCSEVVLWSPSLPDVLLLVLLSDGDITSVRLELMLEKLPEGIVLHAERVVQDRSDVVLSGNRASDGLMPTRNSCSAQQLENMSEHHSQYPDEALVQLGVGGLQVIELDGFA